MFDYYNRHSILKSDCLRFAGPCRGCNHLSMEVVGYVQRTLGVQ